MLSLVFLYVFNFGLLVFMSCVNYIIENKKKKKETPAHSFFFSEFCIILINTFLLEHSWASASDFIFDIKIKQINEIEFSITHFYRKSKIMPKSRVALKLGNLRFALQ